jgi:LytS/YehU family sensor histidine kinase
MGMLESALPWSRWQHGLAAAAVDGMLRYLGFDLLLYILVVLATEAAANAWESRRRGIAAAAYAHQLAEARLHVLSAQLQPHFLFNTLHAISALVWEDQARAERLLARLSEMLRLTLRSGTRVETTLDEEIALLRRYADIQETRYGDRLRVRIDVEPRVRDALVPRLILQPLVENAIRHGVTRRITPGRVDVRAWEDAGRLHLVVSDDGVGLGPRPRPEGVGLSITRARLRQLYGAAQRFELSAAPRGGTVCAMAIPLRTAAPPSVPAAS